MKLASGVKVIVNHKAKVESGEHIQYYIQLTAESGSDKVTKDIAFLHAKENMYLKGLQKDHYDLVNMGGIADSLANIIRAYLALGKLDYIVWSDIKELYKPFLERSLKWKVIEAFLTDPFPSEEWE